MQAFGEARDGDVGPGFSDFVMAPVEVERLDGELGTPLVPVPDLRAGSP